MKIQNKVRKLSEILEDMGATPEHTKEIKGLFLRLRFFSFIGGIIAVALAINLYWLVQ